MVQSRQHVETLKFGMDLFDGMVMVTSAGNGPKLVDKAYISAA
jgi:hypothetical protein